MYYNESTESMVNKETDAMKEIKNAKMWIIQGRGYTEGQKILEQRSRSARKKLKPGKKIAAGTC